VLNAQVKRQGDAVRAAERTLELALVRYRNGASTYLDVVVAQTAALDAARKALELRTEQLSIAVATIKALVGARP
jgi:outer membrane protein, multidrug efflux system